MISGVKCNYTQELNVKLLNARPYYKYQYKLVKECIVGYERKSGSNEATCRANRTWSGEPLECVS